MKIDVFNTKLTPFDCDVNFRVMTPDGYENSDVSYPVLYMHDGQDIFLDEDAVNGQSWGFAKYYKAYGKYLPKVILVTIDSPMNNSKRTAQYSPYSKHFDVKGKNFETEIHGVGKEYLHWLIYELKPWVDANYQTRPEKEYTGICGDSTAGVLSTYALLKYPDVFTRLITISSAYYIWYDCLEKTISQSTFDHIKYIYLDVGDRDEGRMTSQEQFLEGNRMMYQRYLDLGFDEKQVRFQIFEGDRHTQSTFGRRFPDALRWVFQDV